MAKREEYFEHDGVRYSFAVWGCGAAEAAKASQYAFIECPFYVFLHQGYGTFAFFRIHTCVFIGKFCIFHDFLH